MLHHLTKGKVLLWHLLVIWLLKNVLLAVRLALVGPCCLKQV